MVANQERRALVQQFRQLAVRYGVARVSDTAGKGVVMGMVDQLLAATSMSKKDRDATLKAKRAYEATWASSSGARQAESDRSVAVPAKEWKFRAAQFTYNCSDGEWASSDPVVLRGLFDRFVAFAKTLVGKLASTGMSATMETSKSGQAHVHMYFHSDKIFQRRGAGALDIFAFEGIRPHVEPNKATGGAFAGAVRHGHFYVVVDKVGTLFNWTDFEPFAAYAVEAWWLDNLLKQEKLTHETYLAYAARVGIGFQRRLGDIQAVQRFTKEKAMRDLAERERSGLAASLLPMKTFPEVEQFLAYFSGSPHFRRPVLAIVGGTNLGKSMLAADVLRKVGDMVGPTEVLEVTVELNEHLDFAEFDCRRHAGVLLDGVGDALILKKNREALQGRPKLCKGGQSATIVYAYKYTLANRAVVSTFDLSAKNLDALETDHWLMDARNVIRLYLREKAWVERAEPSETECRASKRRQVSGSSAASSSAK